MSTPTPTQAMYFRSVWSSGRLLADALKAFIAEPSTAQLQVIERAADSVARHAHTDPASTRMLRVKMAVRLCRWIMADRPEQRFGAGVRQPRFADLAQLYAREGAFVDWARFKLLGGDDFAGSFFGLRRPARCGTQEAEAFNQTFAQALQVWNREPRAKPPACRWRRSSNACSPAGQQTPVLLLVADGLSYSIFRELCGDMEALGWDEQVAGPNADACGRYRGAADDHRSEPHQPTVRAAWWSARRRRRRPRSLPIRPWWRRRAPELPVVFHKGDLSDAEGLSSTVRDAIASTQQQVVAVVPNAVDDHLQRIKPDPGALDGRRSAAARTLAQRGASGAAWVIVTADHGHVIDDGTVQRGQGRAIAGGCRRAHRTRAVGLRGRPSENRVRQCGGLRVVGGRATRGQEKRLSRRRIGAGRSSYR